MYIEKNVCDSIISTLLNISGKTKDEAKSRLDMVEMGTCEQLASEQKRKYTYLLPACYTLSRKEKIEFCQCLVRIKIPSSYSSNI